MYLADVGWHPNVAQTARGIAALLSSLYFFAHSIALKGPAAEQWALAYAVLRFLPAIRTLAGLGLNNKVPRPEEKAALAEALFHALKDLSSRGSHDITSRATRRFGTGASNETIVDSDSLTLDFKALTCDFEIVSDDFDNLIDDEEPPRRLVLPKDTSVLALLSYIECCNPYHPYLRRYISNLILILAGPISLECHHPCTRFVPRGARRARDVIKPPSYLLKELLNVFLNRAGSFGTTVSLVLGLVTPQASVEQELTPMFEHFRQSLERTKAGGDTAIYDALNSVRRMLTQYRPDLPNLRKRIIIVSDGEDTSSDASSREDLETMLCSGERPPRARMPLVTSDYQLRAYQDIHVHRVDMIAVDILPPRAEHPLLQQPVKSAANSVGMTGRRPHEAAYERGE
ncbi:hypothetical protein B0H19DRAFT_1384994 [Mycena capillaripes]|nr:hypothetical protein B0H19DRAFT_1384994 [Mycena capillaripes]